MYPINRLFASFYSSLLLLLFFLLLLLQSMTLCANSNSNHTLESLPDTVTNEIQTRKTIVKRDTDDNRKWKNPLNGHHITVSLPLTIQTKNFVSDHDDSPLTPPPAPAPSPPRRPKTSRKTKKKRSPNRKNGKTSKKKRINDKKADKIMPAFSVNPLTGTLLLMSLLGLNDNNKNNQYQHGLKDNLATVAPKPIIIAGDSISSTAVDNNPILSTPSSLYVNRPIISSSSSNSDSRRKPGIGNNADHTTTTIVIKPTSISTTTANNAAGGKPLPTTTVEELEMPNNGSIISEFIADLILSFFGL